MSEAFDETFGEWNVRIAKARMVWFALAQKSAFVTTPSEDPFAHYGAESDYHFELGNSQEEARAALHRTVRLEG